MLLQKVHVENFPQKIDKVFPRLFCFYRGFGCFLAMGVQKHNKKRSAQKIVSKRFYKIQNRFFVDFLCNHVFGRFSVRGVQKHHKKLSKKNLTLLLF
jgi:hypothetical protein